jgi:hypothetical protein
VTSSTTVTLTGLVDSGRDEEVGAEGSYNVWEEFIDGALRGKSGSFDPPRFRVCADTLVVGSTGGAGTGAGADGAA